MKYRKLIEKFLSRKLNQNNTNAQVAVALVAGLAAGAIISILLAPDKGTSMRKSIAGKARSLRSEMKDSYASFKNRLLGNQDVEESLSTPEVPHFTHTVTKKRKSDIKSLIEAEHNSHHTDESLN